MSRNVAKTSGAIEGRRLGDAALFFSENRVIGIAPYSGCRGHMVSERSNFLRILLFFFSFFVSRPRSRKIPQLTHLRHYRGRVFFCSKNASIFGAVRANGKVSIIKGLRHVAGATNALNSL